MRGKGPELNKLSVSVSLSPHSLSLFPLSFSCSLSPKMNISSVSVSLSLSLSFSHTLSPFLSSFSLFSLFPPLSFCLSFSLSTSLSLTLPLSSSSLSLSYSLSLSFSRFRVSKTSHTDLAIQSQLVFSKKASPVIHEQNFPFGTHTMDLYNATRDETLSW